MKYSLARISWELCFLYIICLYFIIPFLLFPLPPSPLVHVKVHLALNTIGSSVTCVCVILVLAGIDCITCAHSFRYLVNVHNI